MALPLQTPGDVEQWFAACSAVQQTLEQYFPSFELEHEVWHYFSDADIRAHDDGYRDRQHRFITEYIHRLRHLPGAG